VQRKGLDVLDSQDQARFEALVLPHLDAAFNLARWLLRSGADAEDVAQEAMLRSYRFFSAFHGGDARAWLLQIVRNTCYTWLDRNRRVKDMTEFNEEAHGTSGATPEALAIEGDNRERLTHALESLPPRYREVIVLRELEGCSYKEIASIAGHLTDVVSADQHTVKPWFDGRLDFSPPVRDFADQGFPLQGGRLDVVDNRSVAALVYGHRKHLVNVFVWPTTEKDAAPRGGSRRGYQWVDWRKNGMEFCAVSDSALSDLEEIPHLFTR
jgi:RNA polymerase sigma-70 factor (ECF subfamily)